MTNETFWKLLEPEHPRAEAFCRRLTGNRDEGDDLYQDAVLRALRKFDSLRDHAAFRPWLYRLIVNSFKNRYRTAWWRRRADLTPAVEESLAVKDPSERHTARRWLQRGFAALTPEDQALVVLRELHQWTVPELARLYHRPEGTIKARLSRARQKMKAAIADFLCSDSADTTATKGPLCVATKPNAD